MAFDKTAWDPTPLQLSGFAVGASWLFAWVIEYFVVEEPDVGNLFQAIFNGLTGSGPLGVIWTPLLFGFVLPFLILWGAMMANPKNLPYKRIVLAVGMVILTALWVMADLTLRVV